MGTAFLLKHIVQLFDQKTILVIPIFKCLVKLHPTGREHQSLLQRHVLIAVVRKYVILSFLLYILQRM